MSVFNQDDIAALRKQGMSNYDIMKNMSRFDSRVDSALQQIDADTKTPNPMKETYMSRMIDQNVKAGGPSGMAYVNNVNFNTAQKSYDEKLAKSEQGFFSPFSREEYDGQGLKSVAAGVGNIALSTARLGGNILKAGVNVLNPSSDNTLLQVGKFGLGAAANTIETVAGALGKDNPEELLNFYGEDQATALGQQYKKDYGTSVYDTTTKIYEDPAGFLNDLMLVTSAGGLALKSAGKVANLANPAVGGAMTKFGQDLATAAIKADPAYLMVKGAARASKVPANLAKTVIKGTASKLFNVTPETLSTVVNDLPNYTKAEKGIISSESLGSDVSGAIGSKIETTGEIGKLYNAVRESGQTAKIGTDMFDNILKSKGINVIKDASGNVDLSLTKKAAALNLGDLNILKQIRSQYFSEATQTVDDILNIRDALSSKAKYGTDASNVGVDLFRGIRNDFDTIAKSQIKGLSDADKLYSPAITEVNRLKSEWMQKVDLGNGESEWVLKPNKLSAIRSLNREGRQLALKEVEKLVPDISPKIKALLAYQDVVSGEGMKVASYTSSAILGGGVLTMNPFVIAAGVLINPAILIPILKGFSKAKGVADNIFESISNKIKSGKELNAAETRLVQDAYSAAEDTLVKRIKAAKQTIPAKPAMQADNIASQVDNNLVNQDIPSQSLDDVMQYADDSVKNSIQESKMLDKAKIADDLDGLKQYINDIDAEIGMKQSMVDSLPVSLERYVDKSTGRLPEYGSTKIGKNGVKYRNDFQVNGDKIAQELGFKDVESLRDYYENVSRAKSEINSLRKTRAEANAEIKNLTSKLNNFDKPIDPKLQKKFPTLTPEEIMSLTPEERATGLLGGGGDNMPRTVKPTTTADLATEARKYGSAEEFSNKVITREVPNELSEGTRNVPYYNLDSYGIVNPNEFIRSQEYLNKKIVNQYVKDIKSGKDIKPVVASYDSLGRLSITDGHHRAEAARIMNKNIPVFVEKLYKNSVVNPNHQLTKLTDIYNKANKK